MEQTEIILHILYFLLAVTITCESRFRHVGQTYNTEGGYGYGPTASVSQKEKTNNERYPKNIQYNGAPYTGGNVPGRYTNQLPVNRGQGLSNRGLQDEIIPYTSNQAPPGRFINTNPPGYTQNVNNEGGSVLYDKSLFVSPGNGYQKTKIPENVHIDPRYPLYDGSQVAYPYGDQNRVVINSRSPFQKFKSPSSGQTKIQAAPYSETSGWNPKRHSANKKESLAYDGYPGVRSFRVNPTVHERNDLTVHDNFAQYDSIHDGEPTDYLVVKKKLLGDYTFL